MMIAISCIDLRASCQQNFASIFAGHIGMPYHFRIFYILIFMMIYIAQVIGASTGISKVVYSVAPQEPSAAANDMSHPARILPRWARVMSGRSLF